MQKNIRETKRAIEKRFPGCQVKFINGGKHTKIKVKWRGKTAIGVAANTSSDVRATKNLISCLAGGMK